MEEETVNNNETEIEEKQTKIPEPEKRFSYAEWMTTLFKKFSREVEYIEKNTTDHERAQMSRADATEPPQNKMSQEEIYDEMWKLETKCNKEEMCIRDRIRLLRLMIPIIPLSVKKPK